MDKVTGKPLADERVTAGELDCGGIESRASGRVKPDVLLKAVLSSTGRMEKFLGA
jgi:hypothetical protein